MGRLKKNCMRIMRARKKHYEIIGKIKIVIFKILMFPFNIMIYISFIYFLKKDMLNFKNFEEEVNHIIEEVRK